MREHGRIMRQIHVLRFVSYKFPLFLSVLIDIIQVAIKVLRGIHTDPKRLEVMKRVRLLGLFAGVLKTDTRISA